MKHIVIPFLATLMFAVSAFNCQDPGRTGKGHAGGDQEPEPLAYTLYTEKTELFVEFKPLIAGQESRFAAHFTSLGESFSAITEGSVTLSLAGPEGSQEIKADAPEVPGIFRLRLTPEKPGLYRLVFDIKTPGYTDQVAIDSVTVFPDIQAALAAQAPARGLPMRLLT